MDYGDALSLLLLNMYNVKRITNLDSFFFQLERNL